MNGRAAADVIFSLPSSSRACPELWEERGGEREEGQTEGKRGEGQEGALGRVWVLSEGRGERWVCCNE